MGMVQVSGGSGAGTISNTERVIAYIKSSWGGGWRLARYLTPLSATDCAAPSMPSATLLYHYGEEIKRESETTFGSDSPASTTDYYVRIKRADSQSHATLWVGIFAEEEFKIHGAVSAPQGDQVITAYGLEHLLDRQSVYGAYVKEQGQTVRIGWMPSFNEPRRMGGPLYGNRSASKGAAGVYVFEKNGQVWDNLEMARYVLKYYSPPGITFRLSGQYSSLAGIKTITHFEGQSVYQVLNHLIPRERGFGWCLRTSGSGHVNIHVFSVFGETVRAGTQLFPGNRETETFTLNDSIKIGDANIKLSTARRYETVIVEGERVKSCCTLDIANETLEPGWTPDEELAYKQPFPYATGNGAANDAERQTDKHAKVYQLYKIPDDWDWKAGKSERIVAPAVADDGSLRTWGQTIWNTERAFLRFLPLLKANSISPMTGSEEFLEPLVIVSAVTHEAVTEEGDASLYHYFVVDKMDYGIYAPCSVRMCDNMLGIEVQPQINHFLALNHFMDDGNSANADSTIVEPAIDYETMMATVFVETDDRLRVVRSISSGSGGRVLRLYAPGAELWYVVPGTVVGVEKGELVLYAGGPIAAGSAATQVQRQEQQTAIIRDDSMRLNAIAALAAAWYGPERAAISLNLKYLASHSRVGTYVTSVSSSWHQHQAGTVVSEKAYDFQTMDTRLSTGYWELDISGMVDVPGMSDLRSVARTIHRQEHEIRELRQHVGNIVARPTRPEPAKGNLWMKIPLNQDGRENETHYGPFTIKRMDRWHAESNPGQCLSLVYATSTLTGVPDGTYGQLGYDTKGHRIFFLGKQASCSPYEVTGGIDSWPHWTQKQVKCDEGTTTTDAFEIWKGLETDEWQSFWGLTGDDPGGTPYWQSPALNIVAVSMYIRCRGYVTGDGEIDHMKVSLGRVNEPWNPETLTWGNRPHVVQMAILSFDGDAMTYVDGSIAGVFTLSPTILQCYGFSARIKSWSGSGDAPEGVRGVIRSIFKCG